MGQAATDRRKRQRDATRVEIRDTARQLLVESGPEAMSVSAIARRMGLSGPAIYRYYGSHDELVGAVIADLFSDLTGTIEQARDVHAPTTPGRRLMAMARALRSWSAGRVVEFRILFATPIPETNRRPESERRRAGERFDQVFLREVEALWAQRPFPVPEMDQLKPGLRSQVRAYAKRKGTTLPPAAAHVFLTCWTRLYGLLVMEALDQLGFAYADTDPVFESCLEEIGTMLGIIDEH